MFHDLETLESRFLLDSAPLDPGFEVEPNDTRETATPLAEFQLGMPCFLDPTTGIGVCPPIIFQGGGTLGNNQNAGQQDVDFFSFPASAGNRIAIWLHGDAVEHGVSANLQDADGTVLGTTEAHDTDGDGLPDVAGFEFTPHAGGQFFIQVGPDSNTSDPALSYTVGATVNTTPINPNVEHEPNNTLDQANPIVLHAGFPFPCLEVCVAGPIATTVGPSGISSQNATGSTNRAIIFPPPGFDQIQHGFIEGTLDNHLALALCPTPLCGPDVDFFTFSTDAEREIRLEFDGEALQAGVVPQLLYGDGVIATAVDHDVDGDGVPDLATLTYFTHVGGDYFVQVGPDEHATGGTENYRLGVEVSPAIPEHEPNDDFATANRIELSPDAFASRHLPSPGPTQAGSLIENLSAREIVDGSIISDIRQANRLVLHGEIEARLSLDLGPPGFTGPALLDLDNFVFHAPAGYTVSVAVDGLGDHLAQIELFNSKGQQLASDTTPSDGLTLTWKTQTTEELILRVSFNDSVVPSRLGACCDGYTTYQVGVMAQPTQQPIDSHVEHEPNDTLAEANPIQFEPPFLCFEVCVATATDSAGTSGAGSASADGTALRPIWFPGPGFGGEHGFIAGSLDNQFAMFGANCSTVDGCPVLHDIDFFSFSTDAQREIRLTFTGDAAGADVLPQLLDSNGSVLATAETHDADGDGVPDLATLEYFSTAGGDFFVQVGPNNDGPISEPYALTVTVAPDPHHEHEPNNDFDTSNPIDLTNPFFHCEFANVCPLADGTGQGVANSAGPVARGAIYPLPIHADQLLHGFVEGELVPIGGPLTAEPADEDFFLFVVPAGDQFHVVLTGSLVDSGGQITLFDADHNQVATGSRTADGIALDGQALNGGMFFVRVGRDQSVPLATGDPNCQPTAASPCPDVNPTQYTLSVAAEPITNPIQGPDETEPNDTLDQANTLELHDLPLGACCIDVRAGDVHGIAGGPTNDVDAWKFDVQAGEHVTVATHELFAFAGGGIFQSIGDWIAANHLNRFGDSLGTVYAGGTPLFNEAMDKPIDLLNYILEKHPELAVAPMQVIVYDANGTEIGRGGNDDTGIHPVEFDAAEDATYYAVVSVAAGADTIEPAHYRLGVLARGPFVKPVPDPTDPLPPEVIVLNSGASFDYTDSDGDQVHIVYSGVGGHATITFTASSADGSDIASVVVAAGRRGGNLSVQTDGSAEVGSVEVRGVRRGRRMIGSFGSVQIDGNVDSLASDINLRSVAVDGWLGEMNAPGRAIGQISAAVFDRSMADVGSIRTMSVQEDSVSALFHRFLPWEDQSPLP